MAYALKKTFESGCVWQFYQYGARLWAATRNAAASPVVGKVYKTEDDGDTWTGYTPLCTFTHQPGTVTGFKLSGTKSVYENSAAIFVGGEHPNGGYLMPMKSTDGGVTWSGIPVNAPSNDWTGNSQFVIVPAGSRVWFCGHYHPGGTNNQYYCYFTDDDGVTRSGGPSYSLGANAYEAWDACWFGNRLYLATDTGIFRSAENPGIGGTLAQVQTGTFYCIWTGGPGLMAGTSNGHVWTSVTGNNGEWTDQGQAGGAMTIIYDLFDDQIVREWLAGDPPRVYQSLTNGITWTRHDDDAMVADGRVMAVLKTTSIAGASGVPPRYLWAGTGGFAHSATGNSKAYRGDITEFAIGQAQNRYGRALRLWSYDYGMYQQTRSTPAGAWSSATSFGTGTDPTVETLHGDRFRTVYRETDDDVVEKTSYDEGATWE